MREILLIGAFHEMIELCEDAGFRIKGIIDNNIEGEYMGYPIIGKDKDAEKLYEDYSQCAVVIAPDEPHIRKELVALYQSIGFGFVTVIHPKATISRSAKVGEGTVIQQGVNISANTTVGCFCKLNTNCNVMHDNMVSDFVTIAPDAVLLGYVNVGKLSYIGANSTILPKCKIGDMVMVGAGAVVTKDVDNSLIVLGVPARTLTK